MGMIFHFYFCLSYIIFIKNLKHNSVTFSSFLLFLLSYPPLNSSNISYSQVDSPFLIITVTCGNVCVGGCVFTNIYKHNLLDLFLLFMCIWLQDWLFCSRQPIRDFTPGHAPGLYVVVVVVPWVFLNLIILILTFSVFFFYF